MPTNRQLPRHNPSQRPTVPRVSNRERWTECFRRLWTLVAITLLFAVISPSVVSLALEKPRIVAQVEPATTVDATPAKISGADPLGESRFPGGAALRTDPEQARLLAQAEKSLKDGRIDLAVLVWQKLLDDGLDTLFSEDGRLYAPVSRSVERMLARKGPDVLRVYRIAADAEAAAWMAKATGARGRGTVDN